MSDTCCTITCGGDNPGPGTARGVTLEMSVLADGTVYDRAVFSLDECDEGDAGDSSRRLEVKKVF